MFEPGRPYAVLCRKDMRQDGAPGCYVLATQRGFTTLESAEHYAASVAISREPVVVCLQADSQTNADDDSPEVKSDAECICNSCYKGRDDAVESIGAPQSDHKEAACPQCSGDGVRVMRHGNDPVDGANYICGMCGGRGVLSNTAGAVTGHVYNCCYHDGVDHE